MKKFFYVISFMIIFIAANFAININVTIKQCINYQCRTISLPLYLKALDFFDRHFNYGWLVKTITKDTKNNEEQVIKILDWTYSNIRRIPTGLAVVDDHVWHIIVRGYGVDDQFQDVFTTLCNYSGFHAYFSYIYNQDKTKKKCFSFVKLNGRWFIFDAHNGIYFKNSRGELSTLEDMKKGDWRSFAFQQNTTSENYYREYFSNTNIGQFTYRNHDFSRPAIQSPLRRLMFWLKYRK